MKKITIGIIAALLVACGGGEEKANESHAPKEADTPISVNFDISKVEEIIRLRCATCHSAQPTDETFKVAPSNVMFDTLEQIQRSAERIHARSVATKTMPFMNKTQMTEEERSVLGEWVKAGAPTE